MAAEGVGVMVAAAVARLGQGKEGATAGVAAAVTAAVAVAAAT